MTVHTPLPNRSTAMRLSTRNQLSGAVTVLVKSTEVMLGVE